MRRMRRSGKEDAGPPPVGNDDIGVLFAWARATTDIRGQYLWSVLLAALTARVMELPAVSVLELGVAGGNGLVELERAAGLAEELLGVKVQAYGFDTGSGMPAPTDHRDAPWVIQPGWFPMDEPALRARLTTAQLVMGPVGDTIPRWLAEDHPPVGFIAWDLDYYSSTVEALPLLDGPDDRLLPRIICYFDDINGWGWSEFTGELAAIAEFNETRPARKLGEIRGLRWTLPPPDSGREWPEKMYVAHLFDHGAYDRPAYRLPQPWFDVLKLRP